VDEKQYYAERMGEIETAKKLDFDQLKFLCQQLFCDFDARGYFQQAKGLQRHFMLGPSKAGSLGLDIPKFIEMKTGLRNVWPVDENIEGFDETSLFTVIEFFSDYISKPEKPYLDSEINEYWFAVFSSVQGKREYIQSINNLLKKYRDGYILTWSGEIVAQPASGYEELVEETIPKDDIDSINESIEGYEDSIDNKIAYAKRKFLHHDSSVDDRRDAVRTLGDVLEYLRKSNIRLENADESALFRILNQFGIRHHEKSQLVDYQHDIWFEYFFYSMLAAVRLLLRKSSDSLPE